jgi:hypothetical protein
MKRISGYFIISVLALAVVFLASVVYAQDKVATPAQTRELLSKVVAYAKAEGCEKAVNEINKGTMFKIYKNAYPVVTGFDGTSYANGKLPMLVGQNTLGVKDIDGVPFVKNSLENRKKNFNDTSMSPTYYRWKDSKTNKTDTRSLIGIGVSCGGKYGDVSMSITYEGKI